MSIITNTTTPRFFLGVSRSLPAQHTQYLAPLRKFIGSFSLLTQERALAEPTDDVFRAQPHTDGRSPAHSGRVWPRDSTGNQCRECRYDCDVRNGRLFFTLTKQCTAIHPDNKWLIDYRRCCHLSDGHLIFYKMFYIFEILPVVYIINSASVSSPCVARTPLQTVLWYGSTHGS